ncbi:unnamed protein product [Microthlaspi erraticum]|uniref:Uncharacterized protein n=1 Tax=Microthlaspi erraticum TaxID=1685480 RepID=A0A6D2JXJ9_9BRAS|nr:unnamed protein product [Microthlaspi erraticum]
MYQHGKLPPVKGDRSRYKRRSSQSIAPEDTSDDASDPSDSQSEQQINMIMGDPNDSVPTVMGCEHASPKDPDRNSTHEETPTIFFADQDAA